MENYHLPIGRKNDIALIIEISSISLNLKSKNFPRVQTPVWKKQR